MGKGMFETGKFPSLPTEMFCFNSISSHSSTAESRVFLTELLLKANGSTQFHIFWPLSNHQGVGEVRGIIGIRPFKVKGTVLFYLCNKKGRWVQRQ